MERFHCIVAKQFENDNRNPPNSGACRNHYLPQLLPDGQSVTGDNLHQSPESNDGLYGPHLFSFQWKL